MFSLLIPLSGLCSVFVLMGTPAWVSISIEIVAADDCLLPQCEEDHRTAAAGMRRSPNSCSRLFGVIVVDGESMQRGEEGNEPI